MKWHRPLALALATALLCSCQTQTVPAEPTPPPEAPPETIQPAPVPSGPSVQVDWSRLEQEDMPVLPDVDAGHWYPQAVENLIPREDYGPLYPYVGISVTSTQTWIDDSGQEETWISPWGSPIYGLMTREGKIVTDPVYQGVNRPVYRHGSEVTALPVLILSKADESWNYYDTNGQRYAVSARDGSWCTDFEFWVYGIKDTSLLLAGPAGVTRIDTDTGSRQDWSWESLDIPEEAVYDLLGDLMWLYGLQWTDKGAFLGLTDSDDWENTQVRLFHPETGTISVISRNEWESILDAQQQYNWNTRYEWEHTRGAEHITLARGEEVYTLPIPEGLQVLNDVEVNGDLAILTDYSGLETKSWLCRLSDGSLLTQGSYIGFLTDPYDPNAPAFVRLEQLRSFQTLYTPDFSPFLSFNDSGVYFSYQDGLITARDDETFFGCYDAQTGECIFYRNLGFDD